MTVETYPPKRCPECGSTNISCQELWHESSWMCDPFNPDWRPFHGISYDVWCRDCESCFDIFPIRNMDIYWYDMHPEDVPPEGNTRWNNILAQRNPPPERCGNCIHEREMGKESGFCVKLDQKVYRFGHYCELDGDEDYCWKNRKYTCFWETCHHEPARWELKEDEG